MLCLKCSLLDIKFLFIELYKSNINITSILILCSRVLMWYYLNRTRRQLTNMHTNRFAIIFCLKCSFNVFKVNIIIIIFKLMTHTVCGPQNSLCFCLVDCHHGEHLLCVLCLESKPEHWEASSSGSGEFKVYNYFFYNVRNALQCMYCMCVCRWSASGCRLMLGCVFWLVWVWAGPCVGWTGVWAGGRCGTREPGYSLQASSHTWSA